MSILERVDRQAIKQFLRNELSSASISDPDSIIEYVLALLDRKQNIDDARDAILDTLSTDFAIAEAPAVSERFSSFLSHLLKPAYHAPSRDSNWRQPRKAVQHHPERTDRRRRRRSSVSPETTQYHHPCRIVVSHIPTHIFKISILARHFETFGDIVNVSLKKTYATLQFSNDQSAKSAFEYAIPFIKGCAITLTYMGNSRTKESRPEVRPPPVKVPRKVEPKKEVPETQKQREELAATLNSYLKMAADLDSDEKIKPEEKNQLMVSIIANIEDVSGKLKALSQDDVTSPTADSKEPVSTEETVSRGFSDDEEGRLSESPSLEDSEQE
ncbi:hypothetical protein GEMRC1_003289 [Eukaryota sp. GEM-RC1]